MKIAIIGGNSQVATETAFHLRNWGHEVQPIVRNELAAAFLEQHGFDYAVADTTEQSQAADALDDADMIIISAHAPPFSGEIDDPRTARKTNETIIQNAIQHSHTDSQIVYFSTISVYGSELYTSRSSWKLYAQEKQHLEEFTIETASEAGKQAYCLRLGLVVGPNQNRTHRINKALDTAGPLQIAVSPNKSSNVLHTITLAEAIIKCGESIPNNGVYTVINEPQWTWQELLESYVPEDTDLNFVSSGNNDGISILDQLLSTGSTIIKQYKNHLIPYQVHFPTWFNRRIIHFFRKRNISSDIANYEQRNMISLKEFSHRPLTVDNHFPNLTETTELLSNHPTFEEIFSPKRSDEHPPTSIAISSNE